MLNKNIYAFLLELRENNNREWFHTNKNKYKQAKEDFELFTALCIEQLKKIDPDLGALRAKDCIFRIFRDVRFSNDKRPYKTHFGAFLAKNGRKSQYGGYYIHVEPEGSFLGGGCYQPASPALKAIRKEIFHNPLEFKAIISNKEFTSHYPELYGEKLKTAPRGYPKDFEHINLLNFKNYAVVRSVSDEIVQSEQFSEEILKSFASLQPLNAFLNEILEDL
ncbi:DUF2461 domain-containing protein [Labilibaculum sp.]|uniref:DUF2461 domain-containing protein n=1 Tax=Labilibaculum sp. TaxID=2060723 RepID=UPI0035640782